MTAPDSNRWPGLIRDIRHARHWSQAELGEQLGTDQASVSRWERGVIHPGFEIQQQLEALAQQTGLQSLFGLETVVRASPFPMILVDRSQMVVASSASSGFVSGKTCVEQAAPDERRYLAAFAEELKKQDFWSASSGTRIDYAFFRGVEVAGAVLVPVVVRGEVYALVQKRDPAQPR
jgi:transcriptional regulator with XRE-family HTH domain